MVKLLAQCVPHSSVVGGGVTLIAADRSIGFVVNIMGTAHGITKEETSAIAGRLAELINDHGLEVPARK